METTKQRRAPCDGNHFSISIGLGKVEGLSEEMVSKTRVFPTTGRFMKKGEKSYYKRLTNIPSER